MTLHNETERRGNSTGAHRTDDEFLRMASNPEWLGNKAQRTVRPRQSSSSRAIRPLAMALICILAAIVLIGALVFVMAR